MDFQFLGSPVLILGLPHVKLLGMKRRHFLYTSSMGFGASILGCQGTAKVEGGTTVEMPSFDLHTHPGRFYMKGTEDYGGDSPFLDRVKEMKKQGLHGAFFCLVADMPLLKVTETGIVPIGTFQGDEGWKVFKGQLDVLKTLIQESEAELAFDTTKLSQAGEVQALLACEGGDFLGGNIERITEAYELGIRSIQLVHYAPNELGDLQTHAAQHDGLSELGKAAVKKMNELGIVIDLAHASTKTVQDVIAMTTAPVILSHSTLRADRESPVTARTISSEHARMIAENGGVIGMWPSGYAASLEAFVDDTMRMIEAVGIEHVGIGTDMDSNYKPVIKNYVEFFDWKKTLLGKGLSKEEVGKVAGGNAQRVLKQILG